MQLGYVRDEPSAADKKLARLQGVEAVPGLQSGVGSAEYRDICGGTGKFSSQPGMLVEMAQIFAARLRVRPFSRVPDWLVCASLSRQNASL